MASRAGLGRFRAQWKAGTPSRAAIQWAQIKGYATEAGLTERGRWWLGLGDPARRPAPLSRNHAVRKAGGSRAWTEIQARLLFPRRRLVRGSAGRAVAPERSAHRGQSGKGLRESRPDRITGRVDAFRIWAARQAGYGAGVDRSPPDAFWRELRAENARRHQSATKKSTVTFS